jgi:hypothetical protein
MNKVFNKKQAGRIDGLSWLMLLALALIWGSSYILIKKGLVSFNL